MEHRERWEVQEKWVPWEILAIKENLVILGLKVSMVFPAKRVREGIMEVMVYLEYLVTLGVLVQKVEEATIQLMWDKREKWENQDSPARMESRDH